MAEPVIPIVLSDTNMIQVERQIHSVEQFHGHPSTLYTFISRIDFILTLYHTTDERQKFIILGHIERNISGKVIRAIGVRNLSSWVELRTQLILNYKPQGPNHQLLEEFRNTQFRGNIRHFLEEAEWRRKILTSPWITLILLFNIITASSTHQIQIINIDTMVTYFFRASRYRCHRRLNTIAYPLI